MKALVTGGGGFLGSRISHMLKARGDEVTVLGRSRYPRLEEAGIHTIQADIRDEQALIRAFRGCDTVFHVAGLPGIWGPAKIYRSINTEGTANVLRACRENAVTRLIHTSTPSVVFGTAEVRGVDESQPHAIRFLTHYASTKAAAETMVLEANGANLLTVALRPHLIWGPGDPHLIPRVIDRARRRRLIQVGDGRNLVDITYVDNAAEAHLRAADALVLGKPPSGKAYFISQGEPVVFWKWLRDWLGRINAPPVLRSVSYKTAYAAGALLECLYHIAMVTREPMMTRFVATQLAKDHYFNISAAREDFGYVPRVSTEVGTERMIDWILKARQGD